MMRAATSGVNMALGVAYIFIGCLTIADMRRNWRTMGFSHFGAAIIGLAFTCGPHHLFHGIHVGFEGRPATMSDLVVVLIGLPAGATWLGLRVEAFRGGRGERFVTGTPAWLAALPFVAISYPALLVRARGAPFEAATVPNALLVVIYLAIFAVLLRTQLANRRPAGGWSVSGLSLTGIFITCAPMHAVHLLSYPFDVHSFVADVAGVPAGLYFLWVVRRLYRQLFADWRREMAAEIRLSRSSRVLT